MSCPEPQEPRLLPWTGADGRAAYVIGDPDCPGPVSRRADAVEAVQMEMAGVLLGHARQLVDELGPTELRHLARELTQALTDTLRIASRA
ncbi:hypothetical protein GTY65_32770 [Streptomyces sp. SID8379]|uniref:hypothetical protein n=1 Tax=unclassified Streptomyces TaxID=2593676 RepID=UPI000376886E|nr:MULTISPECIES: hypothetical protein [unclassified Streptomyces]MYW68814.1 hypothetical protein [Streptomyces sp. SID8379]